MDVGDGFGIGFVVGIAFTAALIGVGSITVLRMTDIYGLGHWKLNLSNPPRSMWMNVGYWRDPSGKPIEKFEDACAALLYQVVSASGLLDQPAKETSSPRSLAVLDVGFGCGDQSWELARLTHEKGWRGLQYVGLTLNEAQVQTARRKIYREVADASTNDIRAESFKLLRADAARPSTWSTAAVEAADALASSDATETWLMGLDCLYHFSPSRKPLFSYAAGRLGAQLMAFDLILNDSASARDTILARAIGVMMGCPLYTFKTEKQYRDDLVACGYDPELITIRNVTDDVFSGLVSFLDRQDRALSEYGISLGGFKLAQRLFNWFSKSRVLKAVIVVARTKSASN